LIDFVGDVCDANLSRIILIQKMLMLLIDQFIADVCDANLSRAILIQKMLMLLIDQFYCRCLRCKFISHNPDSENVNVIN